MLLDQPKRLTDQRAYPFVTDAEALNKFDGFPIVVIPMIDSVHRYDGHVVQSTGDGIFALFGAPVAHEDHPQRSLYAALRIQEDVRRLNDRLRAEGRSPIQIRAGVNTGEVVVRPIKTGEGQTEYTPVGHTVNLASRM